MAKFVTGQSGNPSGKKVGTLNKRTQLSKLLEPHAEALINKAVELALAGDGNALRLCIERLIPKAKDDTAKIIISDLSALTNDQIIQSLSGQELSITELKNLLQQLKFSGSLSGISHEDSLEFLK